MILDLRILNELRADFAEVRIVKELVDSKSWAAGGRRREIVGDLIRYTRESIAREYQLAKCYAGNGKN